MNNNERRVIFLESLIKDQSGHDEDDDESILNQMKSIQDYLLLNFNQSLIINHQHILNLNQSSSSSSYSKSNLTTLSKINILLESTNNFFQLDLHLNQINTLNNSNLLLKSSLNSLS
jgi:hypothetical protein